ncbi:MAG: helix-turn-helix domain-containing protein, partial [Oscillospiraceae bacterium]|nr:helix-turn-helix domain-containing protein [Oscillospiraceae bacterium]
MNGYSYLTFDQRREIERLHNAGTRTVDIAAHLGRSVAAVYEELKRGYTGDIVLKNCLCALCAVFPLLVFVAFARVAALQFFINSGYATPQMCGNV